MAELIEHDFDGPETLARALACSVADDLRAAIATRGSALLALSGGTTPRRFLELLGQQPLEWTKITATLADERWVPPEDTRSNARLVRETLLRGTAAAARFVPLYNGAPDPESGLVDIAAKVAALALPFDAVVLGMGEDGHCASLFPDGDRLDEALRPQARERVLPMRAPDAGEPRMTLTLAALVATHALYLQIEGAAKKTVFARAMHADAPAGAPPIRVVLDHARVRPQVYWCP